MRDARRRGSVLVLVLAVTMIVGVIGMSSLLAVRIEHRDARNRADAAQAQQLADTGLQLIHARLSQDPDWRTAHTHDVWSADETFSNRSTLRYKLRDEDDGDLTNDDDPVRLIVRVSHGDAVRLASIQLNNGDPYGPELLTNGDMESGTTAWYDSILAPSTLVALSADPYEGSGYLGNTARTNKDSSANQDVVGAVQDEVTYVVSAQVRMKDQAEDVAIGLYYDNLFGFPETKDVQSTIGTEWTALSGEVTPDWVGSASYIYFYICTTTSDQDFEVDAVSLREVLSVVPLVVVRGSYRRELDG